MAAAAAAAALFGLVSPGTAAGDDPQPFARSAATTYQVTFAARACGSYTDVMANQVRDDPTESAVPPGRASAYRPGQPVDPDLESGVGCQPLAGVRFTLGSGWEKTGPLSTVTGAADPITTAEQTPRLDPTGKPTGGPIAGAVTVVLTDEQLRLAGRRQLWAQGGAPREPLPGGHAFGVLRCAIDGRTGGNVQWVAFPPGVRHVYCFGYYVRGGPATGTLTVRVRTSRPAGYPQRLAFRSNLSRAGEFPLTADSAEASFVRLAGRAYQIQPQLPTGWRLAGLVCAGRRAGADPVSGRAVVTLTGGEAATCAYTVEPPPAPPGLTIRMYAESGAGTFGVTMDGPGGRRELTAAPGDDGSPAVATGADLSGLTPGAYTVTAGPPAGEAEQWSLAGAACNGTAVAATGWSIPVTLTAGVPQDCVLRVARKQGRLTLRVVTAGGVGGGGFAVVPVGSAAPGWSLSAVTSGYSTPANAGGDLPAVLGFGGYVVVPIPSASTVDGWWRLAGLGCEPGSAAGLDTGELRVELTPAAPDVRCTATYELVPASRLRVALKVDGAAVARETTTVLEVACGDGSAGRVVLPVDHAGPVDLPQALSFAEPTTCRINPPAVQTALVSTSAVVRPGADDTPRALPVALTVDAAGTDYTVTVTQTYSLGDEPAGPRERDGFRLLPVALIGTGLVGIGVVVALVLFTRRRAY